MSVSFVFVCAIAENPLPGGLEKSIANIGIPLDLDVGVSER